MIWDLIDVEDFFVIVVLARAMALFVVGLGNWELGERNQFVHRLLGWHVFWACN